MSAPSQETERASVALKAIETVLVGSSLEVGSDLVVRAALDVTRAVDGRLEILHSLPLDGLVPRIGDGWADAGVQDRRIELHREELAAQVERLAMNGYHEVVLCGVDIGSYGDDFATDFGLEDLLEEILTLDMPFRLRLSSIDPAHVSERLARLMVNHRDRICPHLHLSLQSGSTLILKRMRRRATREVLLERIGTLKSLLPELVLSADILVGFPTEEDSHFDETLDVVERLEVAFPHVFSYSKRPGTPAARIPSQVDPAVKKARAAQVRAAGNRVRDRQGLALVGATLPVLVETANGEPQNRPTGRADNYFGVRMPPHREPLEGWQEIEITGFEDGMLVARDAG